ncbi:hypothetical protein [Microbacterium sp. SD291]|uniref:hypothetical protein n=1 Tax=Microbacterium sp. SD291 TaxID=2782007 RepID=UPI001A971942|nr:hypothetical protein [Microbacterium sp. SD291]MBO0981669.1 hypothetical protein [Microbacterium sp. SD291]
MGRVLVEQRRRSRHRRAIGYWVVLLSWLTSLHLSSGAGAVEPLRGLWLIVHLGMLVAGLGAAVMVEYAGLLWVLGRGTLGELRLIERRLAVPAWIGFGGLLVSGVFLAPDLSSPLTALKLGAVLLVGLNAVGMGRLVGELRRMPAGIRFSRVPWRVRIWCVASGATSQAAWWSAVLIGALNTAGHASP